MPTSGCDGDVLEALGWGPWNVYRQEPPELEDMRYREPAEFSFRGWNLHAGRYVVLAVPSPLDGPSLYRDLVEEVYPARTSLTVWRKTEAESAEVKRWFAQQGAAELMSARLRGSIEFAFLDTRELCGLILETGSGTSADQPLEATYP